MSITIQSLTEADVEATDVVLKAAYQVEHSRQDTLRRYLALQPGCALVARQGGAVVGFGGALDYGPFASIGLMAVHPQMQQRGIGRLLLERLLAWLEAGGCPTALLDASPAGAPLYAQCGFLDDDATLVLQQQEGIRMPGQLTGSLAPVSEQDLPALVVFDAPCFGAERAVLLTSYWADAPHRVLVLRDAGGPIAGYLIAQARTIGPWVAQSAEAAEQLLVQALTLPFEGAPSVFTSASHQEALQLLSRYGFRKQRSLRHMRRGHSVPRGRQTTLYGQASLGFG